MPRTRRAKPELTESWDDVDEQDDSGGKIYEDDEEREEMGSSYNSTRDSRSGISTPTADDGESRSRQSARSTPRASRATLDSRGDREEEKPRRRTTRSSVEPELVMPSSPDALRDPTSRVRAYTPHFRLNQRSFTSDAGQLRRQADGSSKLKRGDERDETDDTNYLGVVWRRILLPVLLWLLDVLGIAFNSSVFKFAMAMWLLVGAFMLANNFVNNTISNALSPVCRIPGVSWLGVSFCPSSDSNGLTGPAEFDKLVQAQSHFQEVLASTANGAMLPLDMKRSEASIRDLRQVVQYSSLPSRNELVFEFGGFIETARQASQDLSRFNTRIGNAVDRILTTNRWTLQVIEGVAAEDASRGSIGRFFANNLNVFAPFQPVPLSRDVLLDQYLRHTSAVEEQVMSLISEAQVLLSVLDNLDGRLDVIAGVAMRDGISVEENKEVLFATLWTKLGGNRNSVAKLNHQLELLREVGQYRKLAWAHVAGTIVKLQAIRDQLEDLRERVALPETVADKIPLEMHIENIYLGIERLEQERDAGRRLAEQNNARVLSRGEQVDRMIDAQTDRRDRSLQR